MRRTPLLLALGYMLIVAFALLTLLMGDDAMVGVTLLILGFPWTWLLGMVIDTLNPDALASGVLGVAVGVVGAAVNALIIYVVARSIVMRRTDRAG
ncbi:MAG: hypothetical protein HGB10_03520 [Coriobacteriia bacterium]|nr:hypothetical protein [Coriobacteriia bacterium]